MTKENFINKWASVYNVNDTTNPYFIADIEAVIATEIAKEQEPQPQLEEPNGNCTTFDMSRLVDQKYKPTEQPAKPFDKDRFEAMFRAVYQSTTSNFDKCIEYTKENLNKLDAYYATKEGGSNG